MTTINKTRTTTEQRHLNQSNSSLASMKKCSEDCVREKPLTSAVVGIGAGAAIGLVVSVLLTSGERRRKQSFMAEISQQVAGRLGHYVPDSLFVKR